MMAKRNTWALVGWGVVWAVVLWFCGLFLAGFIAGAMNPASPGAAGQRAGATLAFPLLLLSAFLSALLVYLAILPGTRRRKATGPSADLEALERLGALHRSGVLSDDEFASQKAAVLSRGR